ncbi:MAG: complex I NDUFA9 subunit family protein [Pseudomonadota bacterium]
MGFSNDIITIAGGTGFVGRHLVQAAAAAGLRVRVLTRLPQSAYALRTSGVVGQVVPIAVDYGNPQAVERALAGSKYVVNCLGILAESRRARFETVHVTYAQTLARAAARVGASRFVHLSALGVDRMDTQYADSKVTGEEAILDAFPNATILRPSVIFGPGDMFFNRFARLARIMPALPLIGGGATRFQPVYVGDVVAAIMTALQTHTLPVLGGTFTLAGPQTMTLRDIYAHIAALTGRHRMSVPLPFGVARVLASLLQFMPDPLTLTADQVKALKTDNVAQPGEQGLDALNIMPAAPAAVTPTYLSAYQLGGKFGPAGQGV